MDIDHNLPSPYDHEPADEEIGSDELLSDDNLRLPESANVLVRLHAVQAWLSRRREEAAIEVGEAALALQEAIQENAQETRVRRRAREGEEQRVLVEYYLTLEELILQNGVHPNQANEHSPWLDALSDVLRRIEHVGTPDET